MAWSELKQIPNEYNDDCKSIDESILRLINERNKLSNGKRYYPPRELIEFWSSEFNMEIPQLNWFMQSLNGRSYAVPQEPGKLLHITPIMKHSVVDGFEYQLTHTMNYNNGSLVFLEINQCHNEEHISHLRPQLLLDVKGSLEYRVRRDGSHGGGGQTKVTFFVTPHLPDNIDEVKFALIPFAPPVESPPKVVILDQEVWFE